MVDISNMMTTNNSEDDSKKKVVAIVVNNNDKYQRTEIFVPMGEKIHTYQVEMAGEAVCLIRQMDVKPLNETVEIIADFIQKNNISGNTCIISVGSIEHADNLSIQAHNVFGPYGAESRNYHVRYDFDVQVKKNILKRLVKAPSNCLYMDVPRTCAVITAPVME